MQITFVHTPMVSVPVPERREFWRQFDVQYHAAHPSLRHMKNNLWELPHWMHWLAGVLVDAGYTDIDVVDFYSTSTSPGGIRREDIVAALQKHPADVYLFSPMTPNLHCAYEIADVIKDVYPSSLVVFGGVVATPLHKEVAAHRSVDYVVFDRGEYALPALLRAIESGTGLDTVGNLSYQCSNGDVVTSTFTYPYIDVKNIPFPKIDLFPTSVGEDIRYLRQVYALGCPYKCSFCTIQTIGRPSQYFPIERVLSEIRAYRHHYGEHHNIYWGDETFTVHPERTIHLCNALEAEGNICYDCQTRLNLLNDPRVVAALQRSGCRWLEVGLETAVQDSQNLYKQRLKLDHIKESLARLRDAGIAVCTFMVNGLPTETIDDMKRSIAWVCSLIEDDFLQASYLFGLVPYPGSDMYERPADYSMELIHRDYGRYHEEMPPVYRSASAEPDAVYQQFLDGIQDLAQAMRKKPYFGPLPEAADLESYGSFWAESHV